MRSTAFFKLYKICILLHRCNRKIFAKNRFEKSAFFMKIQQNFAYHVAKFAKFTSFNSRSPLSPPIVFSKTMWYVFQIHNLKFIPPVGRRHQQLRPSCLRSRNGSECHVMKRWKTSFLLFSLSKQLPWVKCSHEAAEGAVGKIDERRHVDSEMGNARLIAVLL